MKKNKWLVFMLLTGIVLGCERGVDIQEEDLIQNVSDEGDVDEAELIQSDSEQEMAQFYHQPLSDEMIEKLESLAPIDDSVITYNDLRHVIVTHYDFDGDVQYGELIVHAKVADEIVDIFREVFEAKYPIEKIKLVSEYQNNDDLSMEDNNTSAFNFRPITGGGGWSNHAYGLAIDINPKYNPYVSSSAIYPANGAIYANRQENALGMIQEGDALFNAFTSRGWTWGGYWTGIKDYQHFEKELN